MSIPKKGGKRANTASEKSKGLEGFVAPKSTTRNPRVKTVIQFMEANLERKISLDELADAANLSVPISALSSRLKPGSHRANI